MKKRLIQFTLSVLLLLVGMSSCNRKFQCGLQWHYGVGKEQSTPEKKESRNNREREQQDTDSISGETTEPDETLSEKPLKNEEKVVSDSTSIGAEKDSPSIQQEQMVMIASEKAIRRKGFFSILTGAGAGTAVVYGAITTFGFGFAWGLLLILGGILLAYLGIRLALSAKKDIDTLTARSTIAWLNRPATVGFILNLSVVILCGFLTLLLLMTLF